MSTTTVPTSSSAALFDLCRSRGWDGPDLAGGRNNAGWPLLAWAVHQGHLDVLSPLIRLGGDVHACSPTGQTPLMLAADRCPHAIALLLVSGANVHAIDPVGRTALHFAAIRGGEEVQDLLRAGANARVQDWKQRTPNAEKIPHMTPLHYAAVRDPSAVEALISASDLEIRNADGMTALQLADQFYPAAAQALRQAGAAEVVGGPRDPEVLQRQARRHLC
jgi:ankyrin repeat protein